MGQDELDPNTWGVLPEEKPQWLPVKAQPAEVIALDRQVGIDDLVPRALKVLVELMDDAMSERVMLDAAKAVLLVAGVGKRDEAVDVQDVNGDELRATILRLINEKSK